MFPPKTIGFVGDLSNMVVNIVAPIFREAGYEIIGSDIKRQGLTNEEVVERSDVLYFSIAPISAAASVMESLIPFARPNTLWLHGTSIQNPVGASITPVLLDEKLVAAGTDVGFLHFMVGPKVRSLRGQSVVYGLLGLPVYDWEAWLLDLLVSKQALLLKYAPEIHDELTAGSQVVPMVAALISGQIWTKQKMRLPEVLQMAGPPCWLQTYQVIRNLMGGTILASIVVNHPSTKAIIKDAISTLKRIAKACNAGDEEKIAIMAEEGLKAVPAVMLEKVSRHTDWHIRLEGDMRGGAVGFSFPSEKNSLGLLTEVLRIFDIRGLEKTSCMAQEVPGGGCEFYIGVKADVNSSLVQTACEEVVNKLGGKMAAV